MIVAVGLLLLAAGYLVGSIPFGVLVSRRAAGVDPRSVGSGNIGASNVTRSAGQAAGAATLALDAAKAAVPMLLARPLLERLGASPGAAEAWSVGVGLAAFAGHLWPVWLRFQGGKGVATALGVFLVLAPLPSLLAVVTFGVAFGLTRIAAVGSLAGTAVCCIGTVVKVVSERGSAGWESPIPWAGLLVTAIIALRHRANIQRLLSGTENKV